MLPVVNGWPISQSDNLLGVYKRMIAIVPTTEFTATARLALRTAFAHITTVLCY